MYAPSFRFMSNPYSNNDSFNSGNNGAEYPGAGNESASRGHDANGQSGYGHSTLVNSSSARNNMDSSNTASLDTPEARIRETIPCLAGM